MHIGEQPTSQESTTAIVDAAKRGDFETAAARALLAIVNERSSGKTDADQR